MKHLSVKNNSIHKLFNIILLLGGGILAGLTFISCENFLAGGDVKQK